MKLFAQLFSRKKKAPIIRSVHDDSLLPLGGPLPNLPSIPVGHCARAGIVVVSYYGLPYLKQCLQSIFDRTIWPNYRVVVVDNGSDSYTLSYLRGIEVSEKRLQVVANGQNLGFAAANNIGLRMLDECDVLVLLNNDTVVTPDWLGKLVTHALNPEYGMVGPVTNWTGNEAKIDTRYKSIRDMELFAEEYTAKRVGQAFDIQTLAMFCVAFRREVLRRAGELDEGYKVGMFEDVDYSEAVRRLGLRIVCCEDVFIHHYGMTSFSKISPDDYQKIFIENRKYFEKKWNLTWTPHKARQ